MGTVDLGKSFLNREPIAGVMYFHNDYVRVIGGDHEGSFGSLVTVLSLEPQPRFVLELESGCDIEVDQSEIELADA